MKHGFRPPIRRRSQRGRTLPLSASAAYLVSALLIGAIGAIPSPVSAQVVLHQAHAHNDYQHDRPLLDALDHGFISIEADVHLVGDSLYVAHDLEEIRPGRTLERLYLEPLRERVQRRGGAVYPSGAPLILLIDIKSEAEATYRVLHGLLRSYADILTRFESADVEDGAVTAIVSGNRPRDVMLREPVRFAAYDGRMHDLEEHGDAPLGFIPLISANWSDVSSWTGEGEMSADAVAKLQQLVAETHRQGRMLRFWATQDDERVWKMLLAEGVDLVGSDDLDGLRRFLVRSNPE